MHCNREETTLILASLLARALEFHHFFSWLTCKFIATLGNNGVETQITHEGTCPLMGEMMAWNNGQSQHGGSRRCKMYNGLSFLNSKLLFLLQDSSCYWHSYQCHLSLIRKINFWLFFQIKELTRESNYWLLLIMNLWIRISRTSILIVMIQCLVFFPSLSFITIPFMFQVGKRQRTCVKFQVHL